MASEARQELLRRVKEENDIAEVISAYVTLKKTGRTMKGLCPFHPEKTPSFIVTPDRDMFHCFGCGTGGDVISFIMKAEGLSFAEAINQLARRAGLDISLGREDSATARRRKKLLEINRAAAEFYHRRLLESPGAAPARRTLQERKLAPETVSEFRLGYAPGESETTAHLAGLGFARADISRAGLRFYRRLMFPIHNLSGECVGFGARSLDGAEPKYLNTAENEVFRKGAFLYGLHLGRRAIQDRDEVILVEGYTDLLKVRQAGLANVAAGLGTALTGDQARLLRRFTGNLRLLYDGDEAGRRAAARHLETLLGCDLETRVVRLPAGHDPDSFIDEHGSEALVQLLTEAVDPFLFEIENQAGADPVAAARAVMPLLQALNSPLKRSACLTAVAERLGLGEASLRAEFRLWQEHRGRPGRTVTGEPAKEARGRPGFYHAERMLLGWSLVEPSMRSEACQRLTGDDFTDNEHRRLFTIIAGLPGAAGADEAKIQLPQETELVDQLLQAVAAIEADGEERQAVFSGCLATLLHRRRETRETKPLLEEKIRNSDRPDPSALKKFQELILERHRQRR